MRNLHDGGNLVTAYAAETDNETIRQNIINGRTNPAVVNTRELIRDLTEQRDALLAAGGAL